MALEHVQGRLRAEGGAVERVDILVLVWHVHGTVRVEKGSAWKGTLKVIAKLDAQPADEVNAYPFFGELGLMRKLPAMATGAPPPARPRLVGTREFSSPPSHAREAPWSPTAALTSRSNPAPYC